MLIIDDIAAIKSADRFIAIQREIDGPFVANRNALGQAVGGKGTRTIFGNFLLVHAADDARAAPWADVDADPGSAGVNILAIGNLVGADDLDVLGQGIAGRKAVPGREVDTFVLTAERKFGLRVQFQLAAKKTLGRAEPDKRGLVHRAIREPVIGIDHTGAERSFVGAIFQFCRSSPATRSRCQEIFLIAGHGQRKILADANPPIDTKFTGTAFGGV